jgi:predicted enzyme related to lactoylglutathione lyase
MKIALTSVLVDDPIKAFKFYTEVLGFRERMYVPEAYLAIVVSPEDPDGTGMLLEPDSNPISKPFHQSVYEAGLPIIVFSVADIQAEYERLTALGVVFREPPTKVDWGIQAVFDDTCGNFIQIVQM